MKLNKSRLSRVLRGMEQENLSQILVTSTPSIYYLTGLWIDPGERMLALKVDESGAALYVNHMFAVAGKVEGMGVVEFDDIDDPVKLLAADLKPGVLGVDKEWHAHFALRLMSARPDVKLVVGSKPVDLARMIKDEDELALLRESSRINDTIVGEIRMMLEDGLTELQLARRYIDRSDELGASTTSFFPLICFGANGAEPHHSTDSTVIKPGDSVIMDVGGSYRRAMSDMTRTVFYKKADDEQKKVYELVRAANQAGIDAVKPGLPLKTFDLAARKVIEEAGYGKYFIHRTGHGLGLSGHEPPDVSSTSEVIARPGMVFSIEPGVYLPGKFGVRVEDLVAVTEDGHEVLNALDKDFRIIG